MNRLFLIKYSILFTVILFNFVFAQERGLKRVILKGKEILKYNECHALIIGINDYDNWNDLKFAENDAAVVAQKLKEMGFKVKEIYGKSATKRAIESELYQLKDISNDACTVIFFAGHGETEKGKSGPIGHIVPVNAAGPENQELFLSTISMGTIKERIDALQAKHVLLLFDCCFSGSVLIQRSETRPKDIDENINLDAHYVITAGNENERVLDFGRNGHSFFSANLFEALDGRGDLTRDGYIRGTELALYLKEQVIRETDGKQHPVYGLLSDTKGDFIFILEERGYFSISTNSDEAEIWVDDEKIGISSVNSVDIKTGRHHLKIIDPSGQYAPHQEELLIRSGKNPAKSIMLKRATGMLKIESSPDSADVIINDEYRGLTNFQTKLETGIHSVIVKKSGYYPESKNLSIHHNLPTEWKPVLRNISKENYSKYKLWEKMTYGTVGLTILDLGLCLYFYDQQEKYKKLYDQAGPSNVVEYREKCEDFRKAKELSLFPILPISVILDMISYFQYNKYKQRVTNRKYSINVFSFNQKVLVNLNFNF